MTKDEIIKLAREARFVVDEKAQQHQPNCIFHTHHMVYELLERFAVLVAAASASVEREACAGVLDEMADDMVREMEPSTAAAYVRSKAAAIRARGRA